MRKVCEFGRSMVEMLGVLAIIGVLSVGGIAGYSKAMEKYKLNKFSSAFTQLLASVIELNPRIESSISISNSVDASLLNTLNLVPEGMKYKAPYIYDNFENQMKYYYGYHNAGRTLESYFSIILSADGKKISREKTQICNVILNVVKENSENILYIDKREHAEDSYSNYVLWGDSGCINNRKCLNKMTLDDVDNVCYSCSSEKRCTFMVYFSVKTFNVSS
ncbi:MAG: hypothetical protein IJ019_04980 [Alphaproteobacteria bacterium]|nr:hypothetical protein [Alphaproteobacteria bacterium]